MSQAAPLPLLLPAGGITPTATPTSRMPRSGSARSRPPMKCSRVRPPPPPPPPPPPLSIPAGTAAGMAWLAACAAVRTPAQLAWLGPAAIPLLRLSHADPEKRQIYDRYGEAGLNQGGGGGPGGPGGPGGGFHFQVGLPASWRARGAAPEPSWYTPSSCALPLRLRRVRPCPAPRLPPPRRDCPASLHTPAHLAARRSLQHLRDRVRRRPRHGRPARAVQLWRRRRHGRHGRHGR